MIQSIVNTILYTMLETCLVKKNTNKLGGIFNFVLFYSYSHIIHEYLYVVSGVLYKYVCTLQ